MRQKFIVCYKHKDHDVSGRENMVTCMSAHLPVGQQYIQRKHVVVNYPNNDCNMTFPRNKSIYMSPLLL